MEGYQNSAVATFRYTVPVNTQSRASISIGFYTVAAGGRAVLPVSVKANDPGDQIEAFNFYLRCDWDILEFLDVVPRSGQISNRYLRNTQVDDDGFLGVAYSGPAIDGGVLLDLYLNVSASAEDRTYGVEIVTETRDTFLLPSVTTTGLVKNPHVEAFSGAVTLEGSYNTLLAADVSLRNQWGEKITSADDLRGGAEVKPGVIANADLIGQTRYADVFLAVYDRKGLMTDLQCWEIDLTQPLSLVQTRTIPPHVEVGEVRIMVLDENLTPLTAARELA